MTSELKSWGHVGIQNRASFYINFIFIFLLIKINFNILNVIIVILQWNNMLFFFNTVTVTLTVIYKGFTLDELFSGFVSNFLT